MSETPQEQETNPDENAGGSKEGEVDTSEEATGNTDLPPNAEQAATPAGDDYAQEGGPTVQDQAVNAAANEEARSKNEGE